MSDLVLLSGWGIDARIWQPLATHWPTELSVTTPDWPGYGQRSALDVPGDVASLAGAMASELPGDAIWVGWSLGGLLAGALLDHLPAPRALVLLGMGARFPDVNGISDGQLATFQRAFSRAPEVTQEHFLRRQLQGEPAPLEAQRYLHSLVGTVSPADTATLAAGLDHLARLDITSRLAKASCPVYRVAGERDPLLAPALRANADYQLPDAGHCPMLSCPAALTRCLASIAKTTQASFAEERLP